MGESRKQTDGAEDGAKLMFSYSWCCKLERLLYLKTNRSKKF